MPCFLDYVRRYTDLPFLVTLEEQDGLGPREVPDRGRPLEGSERRRRRAAWQTVVLDGRTGEPVVPNGSLGFRFGEAGKGRWNLDLEGVDRAADRARGERRTTVAVEVLLPRFDLGGQGGGDPPRGPRRRVGGRLVTTVFDLLLAQYGVLATGCRASGRPATTTREPYTPAWQEEITSVPAARRRGWRVSSPQRRGPRAGR